MVRVTEPITVTVCASVVVPPRVEITVLTTEPEDTTDELLEFEVIVVAVSAVQYHALEVDWVAFPVMRTWMALDSSFSNRKVLSYRSSNSQTQSPHQYLLESPRKHCSHHKRPLSRSMP